MLDKQEMAKMRDRNMHLSAYDVVDRKDSPVKDALVETLKSMKGNENCIVAARTNPEKKSVDVKIVTRKDCGPYGFEGPFGPADPFEQTPPNTEAKTNEREFTVTKEQAKAFFGEEPVLASGQLGMSVVRHVRRGTL